MTASILSDRTHSAGSRGGGSAPVVELTAVTRDYPGGVQALRGVDLTINAGELVAIVGPSGSGKSTMLNMIGTLDRPTTGTVSLDGFAVADLSDTQVSALRATRIGFVFQHFHLAPGVSAVANVADGMLYGGFSPRERRERALAALASVGLADRAGHRPHQLSGGEKQRVAIARAIAHEPRLLLADEPTGALDTASGAVVMDILRGLNKSGTAVVVITHDVDIARSLPRQISMRDGQIVGQEHP
jgi:putative ABC transport system ATP-binding protein